jgi:hypothetical protein
MNPKPNTTGLTGANKPTPPPKPSFNMTSTANSTSPVNSTTSENKDTLVRANSARPPALNLTASHDDDEEASVDGRKQNFDQSFVDALPDSNPLILKMVALHGLPFGVNADTVWFQIKGPERKEPYSAKSTLKAERNVALDHLIWVANDNSGITQLDHDIRVDFYHGGKSGMGKEGLFHFWFNTRMLQPDDNSVFRLVLEKMELDKARKDMKHQKYPEGMTVELVFQSVLLEYLKTLEKKDKS